MSAEDDITTLLSHAQLAASGLAAQSEQLVTEAVSEISSGGFPGWVTQYSEQGMDFPTGILDDFFTRGGTSPIVGGNFFGNPSTLPTHQTTPLSIDDLKNFPAWPEIDLGTPPNTQKLDEIDARIDEIAFPTLSLPTFNYPQVAGAPRFTASPPATDATVTLPSPPDTRLDAAPTWLSPRPITDLSLSVAAPVLADIDVDIAFDERVFDETLSRVKALVGRGSGGVPGLDAQVAEINADLATLRATLFVPLLNALSSALNDKYAPALGTVIDAAARLRLTDRLDEETTRVRTALGYDDGWDLPAAVQAAFQATRDRQLIAWRAHANSQADTQAAETTLAFFEFCGQLAADLMATVQKLRAKELDLTLTAHRTALAYAKATVAALLVNYEATNLIAPEVALQKAEAQLKVFEAQLTVALLEYEVARGNLQVQQALQENDALDVQLYQTDLERLDANVRLYAGLVAAERSKLAAGRLPQELFVLQVKAFDAEVSALEAKVAAEVAEIDGDVARVEGQLKLLAAYEAKLQGFRQQILAKRTLIDAQIARNDTVIDEYKLRVRAVLGRLEHDELENAYILKKYIAAADRALADAKHDLEAAEVELNFQDRRERGELRARELEQNNFIDLTKSELQRLQAIAQVNGDGADITADMARGAMSALNSVASAIFGESI